MYNSVKIRRFRMYSKEIKEKVLYLLSQGETVKRVQEILAKENEITISMPTIYSWKKKAIGVSKEEQSKVSKEEEQLIEKDKVKKMIRMLHKHPLMKTMQQMLGKMK